MKSPVNTRIKNARGFLFSACVFDPRVIYFSPGFFRGIFVSVGGHKLSEFLLTFRQQ
jgi:hypothetical protein